MMMNKEMNGKPRAAPFAATKKIKLLAVVDKCGCLCVRREALNVTR